MPNEEYPQEPEYAAPVVRVHPVMRKLVEEFIADVRRLCVVLGSRTALAAAIGVSVYTVDRWFLGEQLPQFKHYLRVKCAVYDQITKAQRELESGG